LSGAGLTILLTVGSVPLFLFVSFATGFARLSRYRVLRIAANVFLEVFRGTSLLVQLFVLFYILPLVGIRLGPFETGVLGLGLNAGAYGSEIVRSAILGVDRGQRDAATALNMPSRLAMRRVILPQALPVMLPSFGNSVIELLKGSALCSLITLAELSLNGRVLIQQAHSPTTVFALVLVLYFVMAYPLTRLVRALEAWSARRLGAPSRP
jgi:polar amino acid transport system permease protein